MPGNLRTSLRKHLTVLHPLNAAIQLQATARAQIHRVLEQAKKELEKFGYSNVLQAVAAQNGRLSVIFCTPA